MKICITVHSSPWSSFKGGGQLAVHHLAQQLALMGHQVWVVYSLDNNSAYLKEEVTYKILWIKHIDIKTLNLNAFSVARSVYKLAKEVGLDVIHGNGEEAFFLPWVADILKTKFICTTHAPTVLDHGFFSSFNHPIQLLKELNLHLFRSTLKRSDGIITYSNYSYAMIRTTLHEYPKEKIFQVAPGIHPSWFEVVRKDNQEKHSITFFGRVEYEKGVDVLISAFKKVSESYPQSVLNVIGEGNWEKNAQQLARSLGLEKKIIFHGWKELAALQDLVGKSVLCVLPSRVESFGLTIAEAMASGIPVISTRVAAIPELITDQEHGLLIPADDPEHLGNAILYAFDNKEKMSEMAQRARQKIKSHFTWETTAKKCQAIYENIRE